MNILLLVVGIIFLLSVLIGYKRGLLKIVVSLVSTLLCIVLVMFISPSVSKWIQESTPLRETIQNKWNGLFRMAKVQRIYSRWICPEKTK